MREIDAIDERAQRRHRALRRRARPPRDVQARLRSERALARGGADAVPARAAPRRAAARHALRVGSAVGARGGLRLAAASPRCSACSTPRSRIAREDDAVSTTTRIGRARPAPAARAGRRRRPRRRGRGGRADRARAGDGSSAASRSGGRSSRRVQTQLARLEAQERARQARLAALARARLAAEARAREQAQRGRGSGGARRRPRRTPRARARGPADREPPPPATRRRRHTTTSRGGDPDDDNDARHDRVADHDRTGGHHHRDDPAPAARRSRSRPLPAGHPEAASTRARSTSASRTGGAARRRPGSTAPGLVAFVYAQLGVTLPHYAAAQWTYGTPVAEAELQPGDLVFFDGLAHVGICDRRRPVRARAAHGHASSASTAWAIPWYAKRYVGARRSQSIRRAGRSRPRRPGSPSSACSRRRSRSRSSTRRTSPRRGAGRRGWASTNVSATTA